MRVADLLDRRDLRLTLLAGTLRYRVERIERLTGRGLSSSADRVDFFLALRYC